MNKLKTGKSNSTVLILAFTIFVLGILVGREYTKYELLQSIVKTSQNLVVGAEDLIETEVIKDSSWQKTCSSVSDMAEKIMKSRQNGMAISVLIDATQRSGLGDDKAVENLIIQAYKKPRYSTDKHKKISIEDYKNEGYLACVNDLR